MTGGGTSTAAPILAGIIATANAGSDEPTPRERLSIIGSPANPSQRRLSTQDVLWTMYNTYSSANYPSDFNNITSGTCGTQVVNGTAVTLDAGLGYTPCAGIGSPRGYDGLMVRAGIQPF
jgi:hypothetical protein